MTHPAQDSDELKRRLFEAKSDMWNEYIESKQFEKLEGKLVERVLDKVNVEIVEDRKSVV